MIKQGAHVNKPEPDGTTALHWAAHRNDLKMAELLIRAGAGAAVANDYGSRRSPRRLARATLLWSACFLSAALQQTLRRPRARPC